MGGVQRLVLSLKRVVVAMKGRVSKVGRGGGGGWMEGMVWKGKTW